MTGPTLESVIERLERAVKHHAHNTLLLSFEDWNGVLSDLRALAAPPAERKP